MNSLIAIISTAWGCASPERIFCAGALFFVGWFAIAFSIAVFFGGTPLGGGGGQAVISVRPGEGHITYTFRP